MLYFSTAMQKVETMIEKYKSFPHILLFTHTLTDHIPSMTQAMIMLKSSGTHSWDDTCLDATIPKEKLVAAREKSILYCKYIGKKRIFLLIWLNIADLWLWQRKVH